MKLFLSSKNSCRHSSTTDRCEIMLTVFLRNCRLNESEAVLKTEVVYLGADQNPFDAGRDGSGGKPLYIAVISCEPVVA